MLTVIPYRGRLVAKVPLDIPPGPGSPGHDRPAAAVSFVTNPLNLNQDDPFPK